MFSATVDADEIDLVNKVAAVIDSTAFDRRPIRGSPSEQAYFEKLQDSNRERARHMAIDIIALVRNHKQ